MNRAVVAEPSAMCHGIEKVLVDEAHQVQLVRTGAQAIAAIGAETTMVVLGRITDMSCEDALGQLRSKAPAISIIVLLAEPDRSRLMSMLAAGANGVLTDTPTPAELRDAVLRVGKGERYVSSGLLAALFGESSDADDGERAPNILTDRERYVLRLAAEGRSNRDIAAELFISQATVKTHLQNVYAKLGVANRVQAVGRAIELRLLY